VLVLLYKVSYKLREYKHVTLYRLVFSQFFALASAIQHSTSPQSTQISTCDFIFSSVSLRSHIRHLPSSSFGSICHHHFNHRTFGPLPWIIFLSSPTFQERRIKNLHPDLNAYNNDSPRHFCSYPMHKHEKHSSAHRSLPQEQKTELLLHRFPGPNLLS
jgi:hypothetical protein